MTTDPIIQVVVVESGDSAEATTPELAVYTAATLAREARQAGHGPCTIRFFVDDVLVREHRGAINVPRIS